tara:strand:- start:9347 stop:11308 length:1962 start_codon:yes stop_codon:yes gene_type:complete
MSENNAQKSYDPGNDVVAAIDHAVREAGKCLNMAGDYRMSCAIAAFDKYFFRSIPAFKNLIYPWVNYDWDYDNYVYKFYNPKHGINVRGELMKTSQKGTIGTLMNQYDIMLKLMGQLISDPNPSRKSKASDPGYLESDLYECRDFDILEDIKKMKPKIDMAKMILKAKKARVSDICKKASAKYFVDMSDIFLLPVEIGEAVDWGVQVGIAVAEKIVDLDFDAIPDAIKEKEYELGKKRNKRVKKVIKNRGDKLEKVKGEIMGDIVKAQANLCNLQLRVADLLRSLYDKSCLRLNEIKSSQVGQRPPYEDPFFNQPLTGKYSSSYFANIGLCFSENQDETHCKNKGLIWVPNPLYNEITKQMFGEPKGYCFKPRYAYVDMSPGIKGGNFKMLDGLNPSIANNIAMLTPEKTISIGLGYSVPGFRMQQCKQISAPKFTTIRDLAEYLEDDLVATKPERLNTRQIEMIYNEVVLQSQGANPQNGLVQMKNKPRDTLEPDEIDTFVNNLKKLIKIKPDNSKFNNAMVNNSRDKFIIKKKSAAAISLYLFHNGEAHRVKWIDEPEAPVTTPLSLIYCDEFEGGKCKLSNGIRFENPYIQDSWSAFVKIHIGKFAMSNLKAKPPEDPDKENFIGKKYEEFLYPCIIIGILILILYILKI